MQVWPSFQVPWLDCLFLQNLCKEPGKETRHPAPKDKQALIQRLTNWNIQGKKDEPFVYLRRKMKCIFSGCQKEARNGLKTCSDACYRAYRSEASRRSSKNSIWRLPYYKWNKELYAEKRHDR